MEPTIASSTMSRAARAIHGRKIASPTKAERIGVAIDRRVEHFARIDADPRERATIPSSASNTEPKRRQRRSRFVQRALRRAQRNGRATGFDDELTSSLRRRVGGLTVRRARAAPRGMTFANDEQGRRSSPLGSVFDALDGIVARCAGRRPMRRNARRDGRIRYADALASSGWRSSYRESPWQLSIVLLAIGAP